HPVIGRGFRIENCGDPSSAGRNLFEHFDPFGAERKLKYRESGNVSARTRQACDQALTKRVGDREEHDRYGACRLQEAFGRRGGMGDQHIGLQADQLFRKCLNSVCIGVAPTIINSNIAAILPAELLKALLKKGDARTDIGIAFGDRHQHAYAPYALGLLRARRERPRRRRAAEQRDECAALHSITSSASESKLSEILTPSAFAVFKLITNWNLTVSITGRSAGLTPLSTRPVYTPTRRYASEASTP